MPTKNVREKDRAEVLKAYSAVTDALLAFKDCFPHPRHYETLDSFTDAVEVHVREERKLDEVTGYLRDVLARIGA